MHDGRGPSMPCRAIPSRWPSGLQELLAKGIEVVVAMDGAPAADRVARVLGEQGLDLPRVDARPSGSGVIDIGIHQGLRRPRPGGGRARGAGDRRPAPSPSPGRDPPQDRVGRRLRRPEPRRLRRPPPPRDRSVRGHGHPHAGRDRDGTTCWWPTRAKTSCTCPPTSWRPSAPTPAASTPGCPGWAAPIGPAPGPGCARRWPSWPRRSSHCTAAAWPWRATPSPPTRRGSARWSSRSPSRRRRIS